MTADELLDGFDRLKRQIYSFGAIIKRFFGMSLWKRTAVGARLYTGFNFATRKRYFKDPIDPQPFAEFPDLIKNNRHHL